MSSVTINDDLRVILRVVRTSPERWGRPGGITQEMAAKRIGISKVLYRNLETGLTESTKISTLADVCASLGVDPDVLSTFGYEQVANELRMRVLLGNTMFLDLGRLSVLTEEEEAMLMPILDKLARPVEKEGKKVA